MEERLLHLEESLHNANSKGNTVHEAISQRSPKRVHLSRMQLQDLPVIREVKYTRLPLQVLK